MKCGRDLVRRQEILPKLQQEEVEEGEEEEEEEEKPRALWRTGSVGRTGLSSQGPDGRGSTVGLARADQPFSHFPSPGPATLSTLERPSKAPLPGRKGPTSNPCNG